MRNPRLLIGTAALAAALAFGGLATAAAAPSARPPASVSGKSVSPAAWTHKVCQALSGWENKVKSLSGGVSGQVKKQKSISGLRNVLTQFLQKVVDTTNKLVQKTDGAGTPNVNQGPEVAQFFHDGFTQLKNLFAQSLQTTKSLPNDPQAFATQADALGTQIDNGGNALKASFSDAQSRFNIPAIDAAFNSDPACSSIHQ